MFSMCYNCTKLITLGKILNNQCTRSFYMKRKLKLNNTLRSSILRNYLRKELSSTIDSSTDENEVRNEEIDYESIAKGDGELIHKLKVIALETEVLRQDGQLVPPNSYLSQAHWQELLSLPTRSARKRYLEYLFKLSKKKENKQAKKVEKQKQWEELKEARKEENDEIEETIEEFAQKYDLKHNNMFLRFYDSTMNQMYNNRLIQAIMFGQKLVIDCGYIDDMIKRENLNCAKQLMLLFAENRSHDQPFDLHFCNADPESILLKQLNKYIPNMYETAFPINFHEKSYLEIFPKDQLVYLTPHCREEISVYDHDAIYIVGALVDKINNQPLSLAKAKREGLRMAKFPLDKYLQWGSGSGKSLTLNQVVAILNDVKTTGNWEYALRHVPRRKIVDFNSETEISQSTNGIRYDKSRRERKWVPTTNVDFDNLSYNNSNRSKERRRLTNIKTIMND